MTTIEEVIKKAKGYATIDEKRLREAYQFAVKAHAGQTRMSGEAYISHPLAVADILTDYRADENSIITALLHDVVEDTKYSEEDIEKCFGKTVTKMVVTLTKLPHTLPRNNNGIHEFDSKIESIRKIFEVMQEDVRVIVIKLCDRLHNMRTLFHFRTEKQHRIAQETLDIYVKIADRLSIYDLKEKLEALSFHYLHPEEYDQLELALEQEKDAFQRRKKKLLERLEEGKIVGRAENIVIKHSVPYSKMFAKPDQPMPLETQVFVQMKSEDDCYLALRDIHSLWKYKRGQIRDYITLGKSNGFQALQTSVIRRDGSVLTFIIQTPEMYQYGRYGVVLECFSPSQESRKIHLPWVENLKRIHQKTKAKSSDYMTALENDILKGSIIIYTEENKTLFLPPKSTALDAAFYYSGKKAQYITKIYVNDSPRGFSTYLNDGDNIRFVSGEKQTLSPDWMEMINTSYGRSIIFDIVSKMGHHKRLKFGQIILQKELHKRGLGYLEEIDVKSLKKLFRQFSVASLDDLCLKVAKGEYPVEKACELLFSAKVRKRPDHQHEYDLEMELMPGKYQALGSLLSLFENKQLVLSYLSLQAPQNGDLTVRAAVSFPQSMYDSFQKSLRGLYDVRTVLLKDKRQMRVGKWLIALFMLLVGLDPVFAYMLINTVQVPYLNLLSIRFITIFLVISSILILRRLSANYVKEAPIPYWNKEFVVSVVAFFLTAFFTYLSFDHDITPFAYQLSIYIILFPFFSVYREKYPRLPMVLFLSFSTLLYLGYLLYLTHFQSFLPSQIIFALAAAFSFTVYTHFSSEYQSKQHIHRRYLYFFNALSFFGALLAFLPYLFQSALVLPTAEQVYYSIGFSVIFILIPYILYFIISGIYSYTSDVWKKFITIVLIAKLGEWAILGLPLDLVEVAVALALIGSYWIFSRTLKSRRITLPHHS